MSSKKTKLLIVTDFFIPHWTGLSKSILNLTQALKADFDISVLTVKFDKKLLSEEIYQGVNIIREPYLFTLSRSKYSIALVFRFLKQVKDYDVVLINSPCSNILFLSLIAKIFRKKLLIFHQGDLILPKGLFNKIVEKIFDAFTLLSFVLADKISTYTEDYAKHSRVMKSFLPKFTPLILPVSGFKIAVSTAGIPTARKSEVALSTGGKKGETVAILKHKFGFAGRFVEEKGFDILLKAIPEVLKEIPNAEFVFAGQTKMEYENTYEKLKTQMSKLKTHLKILGLLDYKKLEKFYKDIDFIVIPSRSDCFNMVQAEAMLSGTPSIVSNIPGARYLVKTTGFGYIFEKENPEGLAKTLISAAKKNMITQKEYQKVLEVLNLDKNVKEIERFIKS